MRALFFATLGLIFVAGIVAELEATHLAIALAVMAAVCAFATVAAWCQEHQDGGPHEH